MHAAAISMFIASSSAQGLRTPTISGSKDTIIVSGSIYLGTQGTGPGMDPLGGVVIFSSDNSQDGSGYFAKAANGTHYYKSKPDTVIFSAIGSYLYFLIPQEGTKTTNSNGQYNVSLNRKNIILDSSKVMFLGSRPEVMQINLQAGIDTIIVSNCLYLGSQSSGSGMDPLAGVVIFSTNNLQDGTGYFDTVCAGTHYYKSKPDTVIFKGVGSALYMFVPQEGAGQGQPPGNVYGAYDVYVNRTHYALTASNVIFLDPILSATGHSKDNIPPVFNMSQNYPNPFNPTTIIQYGLPTKSHVTLTIFNALGQQVATLVNGVQEVGYHEVKFDGSSMSSGMYFYRLQAGSFVQTRKLLLLR